MLAAPPGGKIYIYRELGSVGITWAHDAVNISLILFEDREGLKIC
jgi:hypothetical protein